MGSPHPRPLTFFKSAPDSESLWACGKSFFNLLVMSVPKGQGMGRSGKYCKNLMFSLKGSGED